MSRTGEKCDTLPPPISKRKLGGTIIHLSTEAEFLVVTSSNGFYSSVLFIKSGLKQVYNVNIVYGNLKSEISQDFAHKPQGNEIVRS